MKRPEFKYPNFICNRYVSGLYYNKSPRNINEIGESLCQVIDKHAPQKIYIGITHHPCGRYTGYYEEAQALPNDIQENVNFKNNDLELNEVAHCHFYGMMYVICSVNDDEEIRGLEKEAIAYIKKERPGILLNGNNGGGGNLSESDKYFLYVCISKVVLG